MQEPLDVTMLSGGVAQLTINRTGRANSFDPELTDAMLDALERCAADPDVRALVLLGNGRTFCAGVDLNWMKASGGASVDANYRDAMKLATILHRLNTFPMPTLVALKGPAIGLGVGLVACCDVALAADIATFRLSEVRLGLIPSVISPYLVAAIGARGCRRYFLTAESFSAAEAARLGLIHEVCSLEGLGKRVGEVADHILKGRKEAQRAAKRLVDDVRLATMNPTLMEDTARRLADIRGTPDAQAALAEFLTNS